MSPDKATVCLDSNIFCCGVRAQWGAPKGVLILAASGVFDLVLLEPVRDEVLNALTARPGERAEFERLLRISRARLVPAPSESEITAVESFLPYLRHVNDLAVLAAALNVQPDWFLSDNPAHFGPDLAAASGLNISTSGDFLRRLVVPQTRPGSL